MRIAARRLLVVLDCCHAEGMAAASRDLRLEPPDGFEMTAPSEGLVAALKQGEGRAVFSASRGNQRAYERSDRTQGIFTYHLIEALKGAGTLPGLTEVRLSHLMSHLGRAVPETAKQQWGSRSRPRSSTWPPRTSRSRWSGAARRSGPSRSPSIPTSFSTASTRTSARPTSPPGRSSSGSRSIGSPAGNGSRRGSTRSSATTIAASSSSRPRPAWARRPSWPTWSRAAATSTTSASWPGARRGSRPACGTSRRN